MAFEYKTFSQVHVISDTAEDLIVNSVSAELLYLRMIHLSNIGVGVGVVDIFLVPNVAGALGTPNADDRIWQESVAADSSVTLEFPVPGLVLEYNDVLRVVCDAAATVNITVTGGRDY